MMIKKIFVAGAAALAFASCGTKKQVVSTTTTIQTTTTVETKKSPEVNKEASLAFVRKVYDKALYQQNLVSDITFTLNRNGKSITVPGQLRMRKDEVIRLQLLLPLIRSEVGRIEFTKDYVLFIDRIHKQYVKAKYSDVSFLNNNGINFYSLQALFWNQFFIPGQQRVGEAGLSIFDVKQSALTGNQVKVPVTLQDGKMTYTWVVDNPTSRISTAEAKYQSPTHGTSTLTWNYSDFVKFGSKEFPAKNELTIQTQATKQERTIKASFELDTPSDKSDWEALTTPSDKYQQVKVEDILGKLMSL